MINTFHTFYHEVISDLDDYFPDVSLDFHFEFTGYGEYHQDMANIIVNGYTFLVRNKCGTWIFDNNAESDNLESYLNNLNFRDAAEFVRQICSC